VILNVKQLIL